MSEAIILAGGFGTRLRSVVSDLPKALAPVAGRPFLAWLLDELAANGYRHVVLATGYLHEKVAAAFGRSYASLDLDYAVETSPLGTGGAIVNALQHCSSSHVTILNGDTLFRIDHDRLRHFAALHAASLAMVLRQVADAGRYGTVLTDPDGRITAFLEKDAAASAGAINGGIYRIERSLLDAYTPGTPFSLEHDFLPRHLAGQRFFAYTDNAYFIDIGIPDDYRRAQSELPAL